MFKEYSDILTVSQAAKALGLGRNTVYQLVHTHQIGCKRIGTKFIIQMTANIYAHLESNSKELTGNAMQGNLTISANLAAMQE